MADWPGRTHFGSRSAGASGQPTRIIAISPRSPPVSALIYSEPKSGQITASAPRADPKVMILRLVGVAVSDEPSGTGGGQNDPSRYPVGVSA